MLKADILPRHKLQEGLRVNNVNVIVMLIPYQSLRIILSDSPLAYSIPYSSGETAELSYQVEEFMEIVPQCQKFTVTLWT